jgi:hypothetical protein
VGKLRMTAAFAIGYVLGARAGRDRYDEIIDSARRVLGRPPTAASRPPRDEHGRFVSPEHSP